MKAKNRLPMIEGERHGRLVFLEYLGIDGEAHSIGRFLCDCGVVCIKRLAQVRSGNAQSCGCLRREPKRRRVDAGLQAVASEAPSLTELVASAGAAAAKQKGPAFGGADPGISETASPFYNREPSAMLPDYVQDLVGRLESGLELVDREPFRLAAENALFALPQAILGPGSVYRAVEEAWRSYYHPPPDPAPEQAHRGRPLR